MLDTNCAVCGYFVSRKESIKVNLAAPSVHPECAYIPGRWNFIWHGKSFCKLGIYWETLGPMRWRRVYSAGLFSAVHLDHRVKSYKLTRKGLNTSLEKKEK